MPGLYDGEFIGYRAASDSELTAALREAIIAVDANVLLNLYAFVPQTTNDLIRIFQTFEDRLVVPHQAVREFWRNRKRVAWSSGATKDLGRGIESAEATLTRGLQAWSKQVGMADATLEGLLDKVSTFTDELREQLSAVQPSIFAAGEHDPIIEQLESLLDGHVTEPLSNPDWDNCVAEGIRRVEHEIPPGYKDGAKQADSGHPEGPAGDYLVWVQATRAARDAGRDLVIVTSEEKPDWWWKHESVLLGPRTELTVEFHELTGRRLFLMRPAQLLQQADALSVAVAPASVEDAGRQGAPQASDDWSVEDHSDGWAADASTPWTRAALDALFGALDAEGQPHSAIIRQAAREGGWVSRRDVYRLAGKTEDQVLRGFTRPTERLTRQLQANGAIPEGVESILVAEYPDGVRASYFSVPSEVPELLEPSAEG